MTSVGSLGAEEAVAKLDRYEWGAIPALAYDSDLGLGFGALSSLTRFRTGFEPFAWRLELHLFASAKLAPDDSVELPFHSHYLQLDVLRFLVDHLRLNAELAFRRFSNSGYYGLGNQLAPETPPSSLETDPEILRRFNQYDRTFPSLLLRGRWAIFDTPVPVGKRRLEFFGGLGVSHSRISLYPGSKLELDLAETTRDTEDGRILSGLLLGLRDHVLLDFVLGLLWDTRDHEFRPSDGTFTELSVRASPGVAEGLAYVGVHFATSWFASLAGQWLAVGARFLVDALVGDPPLYELARYGGLRPEDGPGGGRSMRGVRLQRLHGKIKTLLNLEIRSELASYELFEARHRAGLSLFTDTGRVFADWDETLIRDVPVDSPFGAFHLGLGAGVRYHWGEAFVLRADVGYSPTDETTGVYIDIGQVF